jgi:hypothetical protein
MLHRPGVGDLFGISRAIFGAKPIAIGAPAVHTLFISINRTRLT